MRLKQIKTAMQVWRKQGLAGVAEILLGKLARRREAGSPATEYTACPIPMVWTEYLDWLSFVNMGVLARGNIACFDYAMANLPSQAPFLEIGSFCGLSANVLTYLKSRRGLTNPLYTCDPWLFSGAQLGVKLGDSPFVTHDGYREFVKQSYLTSVKAFSENDLPRTLEMTSDEFFRLWAAGGEHRDVFGRPVSLGGMFSFCYIDGNHAFDFARRDFENCDRYLQPGGFLMFDDTADSSGWESRDVMDVVKKTGRYDLLATNPNYFFKKKS
jgi:hypothetical protein